MALSFWFMGYITGCMTVEDCWCDGNGLLGNNYLSASSKHVMIYTYGCVGLRMRLRWLTDTAALTHAAVSVFVNSLFGELKSLFGILISLFSSNKKGICCVVWRHHICHPAFDTELIWKQCEGMFLHHTKCLIFCPRFHAFTTKSNLLS